MMIILYQTWTRELVNTVTLSREQLSSPEFSLARTGPLSSLPFPFSFCLFIFHVLLLDWSSIFSSFSIFLSSFFFFFALSEIIWKEIEFSFRNFLRSFEVIKQFVDVIKNFFGNSSFEDLSYSRWRLEKFLEFSCQEFLSDFEMF